MLERDDEFLVWLSLQIDQGVDFGRLLDFLCDEVCLEFQVTEALLKVRETDTRCGLVVCPESLLKVFDFAGEVGSHQTFPTLVGVDIRSALWVDSVRLCAV